MARATAPVLHVFYRRRSFNVALAELNITAGSSDTAIKEAAAQYLANQLDIATPPLVNHVVEKEPAGNITVRPEATLG